MEALPHPLPLTPSLVTQEKSDRTLGDSSPTAASTAAIVYLNPESILRSNKDFQSALEALPGELKAHIQRSLETDINAEVASLVDGFKADFDLNIDYFKKLADHIYAHRTINQGSYDFLADLTHARDVHGNLMSTGEYALPVQIATLFHDIERCINAKMSTPENFKKYDELRKLFLHPWNSIKITDTVLRQLGIAEKIPPSVLEKVYVYMLYHDAGTKGLQVEGHPVLPSLEGTEDASQVDAIADADARDFFRPDRLFLFYTHPKKPVKDAQIPDRVNMCIRKLSIDSMRRVKASLTEALSQEGAKATPNSAKITVFTEVIRMLDYQLLVSPFSGAIKA